jgi:hypothetical protein
VDFGRAGAAGEGNAERDGNRRRRQADARGSRSRIMLHAPPPEMQQQPATTHTRQPAMFGAARVFADSRTRIGPVRRDPQPPPDLETLRAPALIKLTNRNAPAKTPFHALAGTTSKQRFPRFRQLIDALHIRQPRTARASPL